MPEHRLLGFCYMTRPNSSPSNSILPKFFGMSATAYQIAAVVLCVSLFCAPSVKAKSRPQRLGRDPGWFNLRAWLARIDFLWNGRKLIEQSYRRVSMLLTFWGFWGSWRCQLTCRPSVRTRTQTMLSKLFLATKSYLPQNSCPKLGCFRRAA